MALEFVSDLRPRDFYRETSMGYAPDMAYASSADLGGLPLPKLSDQGYVALFETPGANTQGTGLTFKVALVDDGSSAADLGKVVRIGITVKLIATGADTLDLDTSAATETATDITLDATSGEVVVSAIAIANAALDSVVVNRIAAIRIRRIGSHANDTCNGRVILLGCFVRNT
jgi:hypothetical protein